MKGVEKAVDVEELVKRLHGEREARIERMEEEVVGREEREKMIQWADQKAEDVEDCKVPITEEELREMIGNEKVEKLLSKC